mgnify:CR=1 FL=1
MYNMFKHYAEFLNELAIDHDFNTRTKTKSLKLPKIKAGKGRGLVFALVLTSFQVMLRISLTSLQKLSRHSHSVESVCLWWGCPPREEDLWNRTASTLVSDYSGNPFVLVISLTTF